MINFNTNLSFVKLNSNNSSGYENEEFRLEFGKTILEKSLVLENKKISEQQYQKALEFLLTKMQKLLDKMKEEKNSEYEVALTIYGAFINYNDGITGRFEKLTNQSSVLTNITQLETRAVFEAKEKLKNALLQKTNTNEALEKLQHELWKYKHNIRMLSARAEDFFLSFKEEYSAFEMELITQNIALIQAYAEYKAHNIDLEDGTKLTWSYDEKKGYNIKIDDFSFQEKQERRTKFLQDFTNLQTLLKLFEQKDELNELSDTTPKTFLNEDENLRKLLQSF